MPEMYKQPQASYSPVFVIGKKGKKNRYPQNTCLFFQISELVITETLYSDTSSSCEATSNYQEMRPLRLSRRNIGVDPHRKKCFTSQRDTLVIKSAEDTVLWSCIREVWMEVKSEKNFWKENRTCSELKNLTREMCAHDKSLFSPEGIAAKEIHWNFCERLRSIWATEQSPLGGLLHNSCETACCKEQWIFWMLSKQIWKMSRKGQKRRREILPLRDLLIVHLTST